MKTEKDNILSVKLVKKEGKLVHKTSGELNLYQQFVDALENNQEVEVFFEANKDTGTNAQLAKIHASIRKLSQEIGYTFEEMKHEVKRKSGLCWTRVHQSGEESEYCKSLGTCSVEELSLVIEAINEIGETVGVNFQGKIQMS